MLSPRLRAAAQPGPEITRGRFDQRFWWALLLAIVVLFAIWGVFQPPPYNFGLWILATALFIIFLVLLYRGMRARVKLDFSEVRRLITCDQCEVETEGPYEMGDHVFREIGTCPRCKGQLYIKAIYSIESKIPLKRQKPPAEKAVSKD